jgi:16S rRNA (guanine966-N2)-methyltransferase
MTENGAIIRQRLRRPGCYARWREAWQVRQSRHSGKRPGGGLRIVAGRWRGRRLPVADAPGLRPTGDRVRETLFNWLQAELPGSRCLDLFAGSGALGLEALSRGAARVWLGEQDRRVAAMLRDNLGRLGTDDAEVACAEALSWLEAWTGPPFDLVFLDPPFGRRLLTPVLQGLQRDGVLAPGALLYIERGADEPAPAVPEGWQLHREGRAGQVRFALYRS